MASTSPALAYAELLAGGVFLYAAAKGMSVKDVLAGAQSPLRGISTPIPSDFGSTQLAAQSSGPAPAGGGQGNASQMLRWAQATLGTKEGSGAEQRWAHAAGLSGAAPWCSAWIAYGLAKMGVPLPANPAYSGAWLNWSGGTNLHTTDLAKARPGDLLIFDWGDGGITDHVALYAGAGKMISGNDSNNSVGASSVPKGNIVGIVRPHYPQAGRRGRSSGFRGRVSRA